MPRPSRQKGGIEPNDPMPDSDGHRGTPPLRRHCFQHGLRDVEIGVDVLDVVVVLEPFDEPQRPSSRSARRRSRPSPRHVESSADSTVNPASSTAWRTPWSCSGVLEIWNTDPSCSTSSAPASATARKSSSSSTPSARTRTTPRRSNCQATAPVAPRLPPCFAEQMAHVGCRPVAVVGERLDQDGDALRPVALVDDRLEGRAVSALARALRDRTVDVVLRHRVRARLLDRVRERDVGGRSPPPSFAATRIERESLVNSLPRLASAAPFLCLIVDHLLCPDPDPAGRAVGTVGAPACRRSAPGGTARRGLDPRARAPGARRPRRG